MKEFAFREVEREAKVVVRDRETDLELWLHGKDVQGGL